MKKLLILLLMTLLALPVNAQITVPNTFTAFTLISASALNANFAKLANDSLNRTGGTLTGNLTVSGGITIDGADISTYLSAGKLIATSTAADSIKVGGGITAGSGAVAIVDTTGKIPLISSTYFASLTAANLTSIPAGQLTGTITSSVQDAITRVGTITTGTWSSSIGAVSGANLTNLNATNIGSGTVPTARLASGTANNTTFLRGDQTWSTISIPAIPADIVAFSSTGSCPSGWAEYTAGRGFVYVGLPSGGTSGGTVGSAFSNLENRLHTHSIPALSVGGLAFSTSTDGAHGHTGTTSGPNSTIQTDNGGGGTGGSSTHSHTFSTDVNGAHSHSGVTNGGATSGSTSGGAATSDVLSYIQLIACRKT